MYAAVVSDTVTTTPPASAARQLPKTANSTASSSARPASATQPAFLSALSTNVAGRYSPVPTAMPVRPGAMSAIACSMSLLTCSVSAPGNFSTTSSRLGVPLATASPMSG